MAISPQSPEDLNGAVEAALTTGELELAEFWGDCGDQSRRYGSVDPTNQVAESPVAEANLAVEPSSHSATFPDLGSLMLYQPWNHFDDRS